MIEQDGDRKLIRLGRRAGNVGSSATWQVKHRGRVLTVERQALRDGLLRGWLTGIESVRRVDGDWGPLFGRPIYREVFQGTDEPRDHARARAEARLERLSRTARVALACSAGFFVVSLPFVTGGTLGQAALLATLVSGLVAASARLLAAVHQRELENLVQMTVPPVLAPPEPVDWAALAAADEVEALAKRKGEQSGDQTSTSVKKKHISSSEPSP